MIKKILFLSLIIAFSTSNANDLEYSYIEAVYKFYYKNLKGGEMFLKISKDNNQLIISTTYKGNILASIANRDFREEISTIEIIFFGDNVTLEAVPAAVAVPPVSATNAEEIPERTGNFISETPE